MEMMPPNVVFVASPNNRPETGWARIALRRFSQAPGTRWWCWTRPTSTTRANRCVAGVHAIRGWRFLRTLSKVGLAALRVGWLEGDEALLREVDKVRQPFNVSATSQAAAAAVLAEAWDDVREQVGTVVRERARLTEAIRGIAGCDVPPSSANFVWVGTPRPAAEVHAALLARGVLVRSFHGVAGRLASRLRITVGTSQENDALLDALRAALG